MILTWYDWAILGVVLMGSELLVPAFVLVWFGLGACLLAGFLALYPDTPLVIQLVFWLTGSLIFVLLWFKVFKNARHKTMSGRASAEIVGEVGLLVGDVDPFKKGQVRLQRPMVGSDLWDCMADTPIKAGTRVKIVSVEGSLLKITSAEKTS